VESEDEGGVEEDEEEGEDEEEQLMARGRPRSRSAQRPKGAKGRGVGQRRGSKARPPRGAVTAVEVHQSWPPPGGGGPSKPLTEADKALAAAFAVFRAIPLSADGRPAACLEDVMPWGHPLQAVPAQCAQMLSGIRDAKLSPGMWSHLIFLFVSSLGSESQPALLVMQAIVGSGCWMLKGIRTP
jgi:hypothetical protein